MTNFFVVFDCNKFTHVFEQRKYKKLIPFFIGKIKQYRGWITAKKRKICLKKEGRQISENGCFCVKQVAINEEEQKNKRGGIIVKNVVSFLPHFLA